MGTVTANIILTATWSAVTSNAISYDNQAATTSHSGGSAFYTTAAAIAEIPTFAPEKNGYTFIGWFTLAAGGTQVIDASYTPSSPYGAVTLYAQWSGNALVIVFNSQSGSEISNGSTITGASILASPGTPTRSEFSFSGWSTTTSGSVITFPYAHAQAADFTLYAIWVPGIVVSFISLGTAVSPLTFTGSAMSKPSDPTRANYTFVKWQDSATAEISWPYTPSAPIELSAVWNGNTYRVTFESPRATVTQVIIDYTHGLSSINLPNRVRDNYVFQGWYSADTGGSLIGKATATLIPTQATILYAQWVQTSLSNIPAADLTLAGELRASSTQARTLIAETTSSSVSVRVPAGALPDGTFVEVYSLDSQVNTTSLVGIEGAYVVNLVVAWHTADGLVPNATTPIFMTIRNSSIKKGANVYSILEQVVKKIGVATIDGEVISEFSEDPLILVTNPAPVSITVALQPEPSFIPPTIVISSAENDAKTIETAQAQADKILEEAKKQADAILDKARREAKVAIDAEVTKILDQANAKAALILDAANTQASKILAEIKVATPQPTPKVPVKPKPTTVTPKVEPIPKISVKPIIRTITIQCKRGNITKNISGSEPTCPLGYAMDTRSRAKSSSTPATGLGKQITITCTKGALNKRLTGQTPKCPAGFVQKN